MPADENWDRPPADIALAELFERWLPGAFAATGQRAPAGTPVLRVSVSGAGGGAWELALDGTELRVAPPGREPPDIWIRLSLADVRLLLGAPDPDLPAIVPPGWSARDILLVDPRDVDLVKQVSGRVLVEIEGKRRRRFALDVGFGKAGVGAGRPRTTIRLDAPTFEGLRSGAVAPMQPLVDGRLKIEGDRALAMQLLLLVGSRLGRR
ncbi:MAG TPA: SCP2 sterol-binding domain-containing protein [Polyangia bacterium]|nr:SCP2 sterol-binding domain-containing protein [Polyangia bacterium]